MNYWGTIGGRVDVTEMAMAAAVPLNQELTRALNEKVAIIAGLAELLLQANRSLDETAQEALHSICRQANELRDLFLGAPAPSVATITGATVDRGNGSAGSL